MLIALPILNIRDGTSIQSSTRHDMRFLRLAQNRARTAMMAMIGNVMPKARGVLATAMMNSDANLGGVF